MVIKNTNLNNVIIVKRAFFQNGKLLVKNRPIFK